MFSIAFVHCCVGRDILIFQSITLTQGLSVMSNRNAVCLNVFRWWSIFFHHDATSASTLSSFALRTGPGCWGKVEWLIHMCFHCFRRQRYLTKPLQRCTILSPAAPPSTLCKAGRMLSTSPFPPSLKSCRQSSWSFGCSSLFPMSLWRKHFLFRWTSWYSFRMEFSPFLGLLHFPFLKHRKIREKNQLLRVLVGHSAFSLKYSTGHARDHGGPCSSVSVTFSPFVRSQQTSQDSFLLCGGFDKVSM